jgi:hypothetical protein
VETTGQLGLFGSYTRKRLSVDGNIVPRAERTLELCRVGAASRGGEDAPADFSNASSLPIVDYHLAAISFVRPKSDDCTWVYSTVRVNAARSPKIPESSSACAKSVYVPGANSTVKVKDYTPGLVCVPWPKSVFMPLMFT